MTLCKASIKYLYSTWINPGFTGTDLKSMKRNNGIPGSPVETDDLRGGAGGGGVQRGGFRGGGREVVVSCGGC